MPARAPLETAEPPFVSRLLRSHGHMRFRHGVFRAQRQGPGTCPPLGPARAGPPFFALPPARGPPAYLRACIPGASLPGACLWAAQLRRPLVVSEQRVDPSMAAWRGPYLDVSWGPPVCPTPDNTQRAKSGASLPDGTLGGKWVVDKSWALFSSFHGGGRAAPSLSPAPTLTPANKKKQNSAHPGRPPQTT